MSYEYAQRSRSRLGGRAGPITLLYFFLFYLFLFLAGPIFVWFDLLDSGTAADRDRSGLIVGVLGTVVLPWVVGALVWYARTRMTRPLRRLHAVGLAATAEIVTAREVELRDSTAVGVALGLRISGPGFEPFEADVDCRREDALIVGARFNALVDPVARVFSIER